MSSSETDERRCSVCWKLMRHHLLVSVRLACKSEHGYGEAMSPEEQADYDSLSKEAAANA